MLYDSSRHLLHDLEVGISYNLETQSSTLLPASPEGTPVVVVSLLRTTFVPNFYDIQVENRPATVSESVSYPALISALSGSCLHYQKVTVTDLGLKGTQFLYLLPMGFPLSDYLTPL